MTGRILNIKKVILISAIFACNVLAITAQNVTPEKGAGKKILDKVFVTAIAFDDHNNAWIGTFKNGLIKYNSKETVFYNLKNSCINDTVAIQDIKVDSKGNVWIGNTGLIKYDGKTFTSYNSHNSKIPNDYVSSISIDTKDNVWFTSCTFRQGGVVKYDGKNFNVFTSANSKLPFNLVQSITIDKNDNVWLAAAGGVGKACLVKISNKDWTIYNDKELGFSPYYFGNIEVNSKNVIYGSIDYSLSSSRGSERACIFTFDGYKSQILKTDKYIGYKLLKIDNEDRAWCSHGSTCSVYDGNKWTILSETTKSGGAFVVEQAKDNKIWIGTGSGIYIQNR